VPHLPQRVPYRMLVMDRDLDEIVASQNRMLDRDGQQGGKLTDAQLKAFLQQQQFLSLRVLAAHGIPRLVIRHADVLQQPAAVARQVADFLGLPLDVAAMARAVDVGLYRERQSKAVRAVRG